MTMATLFGGITLRVPLHVLDVAAECADLQRGSKAARSQPYGGRAGGTGERVAREPLTGRVACERSQVVGSGPVGERATPTPGQDPLGHVGQGSGSLRRHATSARR